MSSTSGVPSNRRGQYTSRACNECRRRRCKCDGARPTCGSCSFYPSQGRECSWGADVDAHRPPTKQFVESLRVKIQVLEEELARLHALNQEQARRAVGSDAPAPADGVLPGDETLPGQSRPAIPSIAPLSGDYAQQFSRLTPQNKHSAITAGVTGRPLGTIYQFIFNINPSVPPNEQPEAVQQSLVCDWHRYLPPLDDIQFTRLEHDTLLDRCFKYSSCWLMMVIPQFFLCDMLRALTYSQEPAEVEYYSPLLHCSLLAFATALSDDPLVKQRGQKFAERAKQLLDDSLRRPCLSLVQSLAILSEYHCGLGGKEQGYIYLGMSIRAVRALGLGKADFQLAGGASPTVIPDWYFWSIYCQDKVMSLELNTDYDLRSPDYPALELPRIDWDLDRCPWSGISAPMPVAASDQGCRLTQVLAESGKLAIIAESILLMHHSNILVVPAVEGNEAVNIHWRLDAWLSELPTEILVSDHSSPVLLPHIITVNISYWWLVLRLHQPFYRVLPDRHAPPVNASRPFGDLSDVLCDRAAHKIIFLVDLYNRWHGLRFFPRNMIQVIFAAGTIFFKQQVAAPDGGQYSETRAAIQGCIATLRTIAGTWHCAERYAARLQALLQDQTPQPRAQTGYFPPPDAWR